MDGANDRKMDGNQPPREQEGDGNQADEEETNQQSLSSNDIETATSKDSSSAPRETVAPLTSDDDFKTRAVTRKSSRMSRVIYEGTTDNNASDLQNSSSHEYSVSSLGNDFKTRAVIRKDSRRSRESKGGPTSFNSEIQSPGAVDVEGVPVEASTSEGNEIREGQESSIAQEDETTNTAASTATESDVVSSEPIVAQLVEEGNAGNQPHQIVESIREELREDVRRELHQEMIASAVAANAVRVEIVTQDEEDPHPPLANNPSDQSVTSNGGDGGGSPLRYPPVDTGLVCVGLYMLLTMAIASIYLTEFFGGVCYSVGAWLFWLLTPKTDPSAQQLSVARSVLESIRQAFVFVLVGPFVAWDFAVSIVAVAWLELHAFAAYLFVATLNGCGSGRICGTFVRKVFVWKRWKVRRYHSNWKLKRDYLVLQTWQEKELKDDYAILRANFEQQQLQRQRHGR